MGDYRQYYWSLNDYRGCEREECGARPPKGRLEIHHRRGYSGACDSVRNLIALCRSCHACIHNSWSDKVSDLTEEYESKDLLPPPATDPMYVGRNMAESVEMKMTAD